MHFFIFTINISFFHSSGRFDEGVIEERRISALELLNFIGKQSHLYKSLVFLKFLEVFAYKFKHVLSLHTVQIHAIPTKLAVSSTGLDFILI